MIKIGVMGVTGGWSSELVADEVEKQTGYRLLMETDRLYYDADCNSVFFGKVNLQDLDGLILKKIGARYSPDHLQRLSLLRFLADRGLPVFSHPDAVSRCIDRLSCTLTLRMGNIPMPPTTLTEDLDIALAAVREYGRAVFKPLFTSKARGMQILDDTLPDLKEKIIKFKLMGNNVLYIQKMIPIPGRDLGVVFLRGKYIGAYARVKNGQSWNTTTANGGSYQAVEPAIQIIDMARRAQALFGLDFTCVDVVEAEDGPLVFEVSALGGFRGLQEAQGINMAALIVKQVLESIHHEKD
ncbi:MAG TPA: GAK system ATP-grasp enzyme [Syntrophaceae bacterium]|jgi:ribosomal protein S6--L-glutamate ligase|nr:GAK system ATP-grasp enzyme [Smithellaceae bacterium]HBJ75893.1 GAK system ATP-grasp enzyme [Syntrophaceae bacterium]HBL54291.1 GAK system ATP-grasp enzyme [Syntrophaceae bacterium]